MILFRTANSFLNLQKLVGNKFVPSSVLKSLENNITNKVKTLVIEYPYVDKDYRDTYYHDYSKRHMIFDRNCVRVHLFKNNFKNIQLLKNNTHREFQRKYAGFLILRDTKAFTIGRSYIDPTILKNRQMGYYALETLKIHLKGYEFKITAYPWMQQDANVSRCAHVSIWSILRYFSEKYTYYSEHSLYEVSELIKSDKRKCPSSGMTVNQLAQVLSDCNFYPEIYIKDGNNDMIFKKILYVMIESGLPYIAAIEKGNIRHAVAIIGHGKPKKISLIKEIGIIDTSELIENLICSDDNFLPYTLISKKSKKKNNKTGNFYYSYKDITAIVVPFYEKMFLDIYYLYKKGVYLGQLSIIEGSYLKIDKKVQTFRRILLTSSKSFKKFINSNAMDDTFKEMVSIYEMPKFIWLIEYSSAIQYKDGMISKLIIVDATAMNFIDNVFLLIKDDHILYFNNTQYDAKNPIFKIGLAHKEEKQYTHNLEDIKWN